MPAGTSTLSTAPPEKALRAYRDDGPRVWAAAVIVMTGLVLIALGGCFLIGVLILVAADFGAAAGLVAVANHAVFWSTAASLLLVVLFALAALCFAGALVLLVIGLKSLFRVLKE